MKIKGKKANGSYSQQIPDILMKKRGKLLEQVTKCHAEHVESKLLFIG